MDRPFLTPEPKQRRLRPRIEQGVAGENEQTIKCCTINIYKTLTKYLHNGYYLTKRSLGREFS